ncbi:hypothetical protein [Microvirga zambiensis]|uniref:hypothetical protein n=1 Tax=Microvirga zambiensis TaxID=1402137 RepID=UPI00191DC270|nr:hypothetical protein [Microvirga zambiensis]
MSPAHKTMPCMKITVRSERERYHRITAIEDKLARQAKVRSVVLGITATSGFVILALVLAFLTGLLELPSSL